MSLECKIVSQLQKHLHCTFWDKQQGGCTGGYIVEEYYSCSPLVCVLDYLVWPWHLCHSPSGLYMAGEESGIAFTRSPISSWFLGSRCQGGALQRHMEGRKEGDSQGSVRATPSSKCAGGRVKVKAEWVSIFHSCRLLALTWPPWLLLSGSCSPEASSSLYESPSMWNTSSISVSLTESWLTVWMRRD